MRETLRTWAWISALPVAMVMSSGCSCGDPEVTSDDDGTGGQGASGVGGSAASSNGGTGNILTGGTGNVAASGGVGGDGGMGGGINEDCLFVPPPGEFEPSLECFWDGPAMGSLYQNHDDVVSTPVVINLTDDNNDGMINTNDIPDIAFISYRLQQDGCCNQNGVLRVVSGACDASGILEEHWSLGGTEIQAQGFGAGVWFDNSGGLAAGDIDGDGEPELVGTMNGGGTIAVNADGSVLWVNPNHPNGNDHLAGTTPSIANLDGVGLPEIISGRVVLNGEDGSLDWEGSAGIGTNGFMGPVSAVVDLDNNGTLNVLAGGTMYDWDGTEMWSYNFPIAITSNNCQASGFACDGYTATGNFDNDDEGELVIVRAGTLYFLNHDGTPMELAGEVVQIDIPDINCSKNEGGPPTVADFDGDGQPEVAAAGADYYIVADLECLADPLPSFCSDPGIRWKLLNEDCSSRVTGSSVFDFDGDGKAEVVYNDEDLFRILDGTDGTTLLSFENHSHTRLEMPIVVDADNDGNAEIVFVENADGGGLTQGIRVWSDASDSWVATRRIWNQHSYHVTNVDEIGGIPQQEIPNWLTPTDATVSGFMNSFRQNLPDFSVFAAPDLTVSVSVDDSQCPDALLINAQVCNQGLIVVGAGTEVSFWDNITMTELVCANAPTVTSAPLEPGSCEVVTCELDPAPMEPAVVDVRACVDNGTYECTGGGAGGGAGDNGGNNECNEDNNSADSMGDACEDDVPA